MNTHDTYRYAGPISAEVSRLVIQSDRIAYFCSECGQSIDVPTWTDRCEACLDAMREAA